MIYKPEIGEIYDTIFFGVAYFNKDEIEQIILSHVTEASFMRECLNDARNCITNLPEILIPFFYCGNKNSSPLATYFIQQIDFENDTIDLFLRKLTTRSGQLYTIIANHFFGQDENKTQVIVPQISPEHYIEALSNLEIPDHIKLQIALLFGNFNYAMLVLCENLKQIFEVVHNLHKKHARQINHVAEQIKSEQNIQMYEEAFHNHIDVSSTTSYYSVSLLNQYTHNLYEKDKFTTFLFGLKHEETISIKNYENRISIPQVLIAVGNDIRLSIINELLKTEELTPSMLSRILDLPPTTVLRHMEVLYSNDVIYVNRKSGLNIFYKLNIELLKKANLILHNKLGEYNYENHNKQEADHKLG